jgi:hypothetical protein
MTHVVTELRLDSFRAEFLSTRHLLDLALAYTVALVAVAPGTGKSHAVDDLLENPLTYKRYDLVVYAAPTWALIGERRVLRAISPTVDFEVILPRPRELCGSLDERWSELEAAGCAAHAKVTLCGQCPLRADCDWPGRLSLERLWGKRLLIFPEQYLLSVPNMICMLKRQTGAKRVLVILDEARFLDSPYTVAISRADMRRLRDAIGATVGIKARVSDSWLRSLGDAIGGLNPREARLSFPPLALKHVVAIQATGIRLHGPAFRFVGHQLADYHRSRPDDRCVDERGALRFELPPALGGDVLVMSAYLEPSYVAHRLDIERVASPMADYKIRHSGTRIFNIKSRLGMDAYYEANSPQILDFFAALIAANVREGRTTTVVTRKKFADACITGLTARLALLRLDVAFARTFDDLGPPDPLVVPVVTYGMVGINALAGYETCLCLNGFYVPPSALDAAVQGAVPDRYKVELEIYVDAANNRRVQAVESIYRGGGFEAVANACLRKLELEPALQAAARVRFSVAPREVWLFEMHDARPLVGEVTEVTTLEAAYAAAGVPKFRDTVRKHRVTGLRAIMAGGKSMRAAAAEMGIKPQTASRWLRKECPKSPILDLQEGVWDGQV